MECAGEYTIIMSAKDPYKGEFQRNCRINKNNVKYTVVNEYITLSKLV